MDAADSLNSAADLRALGLRVEIAAIKLKLSLSTSYFDPQSAERNQAASTLGDAITVLTDAGRGLDAQPSLAQKAAFKNAIGNLESTINTLAALYGYDGTDPDGTTSVGRAVTQISTDLQDAAGKAGDLSAGIATQLGLMLKKFWLGLGRTIHIIIYVAAGILVFILAFQIFTMGRAVKRAVVGV
jgi:hypothetical protein